MKIEKVNDHQIRCTLTREDLADRELKISELAYGTEKAKSLFRDMMGSSEPEDGEKEYIRDFRENYVPQAGFKAVYKIQFEGKKRPLVIEVNGPEHNYFYGNTENYDVEMQIDKATMDDIVFARMTFQRAFMGGAMKMKGDFKVLRTLDQIYAFGKKTL